MSPGSGKKQNTNSVNRKEFNEEITYRVYAG